MDLKDTVELMNSSEYQDRFKAEYYQLKVRVEKLEEMITKYRQGTLPFTPKCSCHLLVGQLRAMELYLKYLEDRIVIEEIDL